MSVKFALGGESARLRSLVLGLGFFEMSRGMEKARASSRVLAGKRSEYLTLGLYRS